MEDINRDIKKIVDKVNKMYEINKIYLFGSYAYGTPNSDSDIDLCIVTEDNNLRKKDVMKEVRKSIMDIVDKPVDILIYNKSEFQERILNQATIEYKISSKGVKVYEKQYTRR